jgi:hypothetical protein
MLLPPTANGLPADGQDDAERKESTASAQVHTGQLRPILQLYRRVKLVHVYM